jgi:hypothetical protein
MKENAVAVVFVLFVLSAMVAWRMSIYRECRAHGFSAFYCFTVSGK